MSIGVLTRSRIYKKNYQKEHKKVIVVSAIEKTLNLTRKIAESLDQNVQGKRKFMKNLCYEIVPMNKKCVSSFKK